MKRSRSQKLSIFRSCFSGRMNAYGTYDPVTAGHWQVKEPVTDKVLLDHLQGKRPYGPYLLVGHQTSAIVADFDKDGFEDPRNFWCALKNYGITGHIERSKSKGYHIWLFCQQKGVSAAKGRLVVGHILDETGLSETEVFPAQDCLKTETEYGNFINAPLFGRLVPQGRTVFVDESDPTKPYPDQWELLANVKRVTESFLNEIIEINDLQIAQDIHPNSSHRREFHGIRIPRGLPPCTQKMLVEGVTQNQRVACFRIAVQLKNAGLPEYSAVACLQEWAKRNKPTHGKSIITEVEIFSQTSDAYRKDYSACGCKSPAVRPFCQPSDCPLARKLRTQVENTEKADPCHRANATEAREMGRGFKTRGK